MNNNHLTVGQVKSDNWVWETQQTEVIIQMMIIFTFDQNEELYQSDNSQGWVKQ